MRAVLALRALTAGEERQLREGVRSPRGQTVRRCQIILARAKGWSPAQIASIVGCKTETVTRVVIDFHARGVECVHEHRRLAGARRRGRKGIQEREPAIIEVLERLLADEIAGDPARQTTWIRSSLRKLSGKLAECGIRANYCTIRKLLRRMGFTLKQSQKRRGGSRHPDRDQQFRHIASQRNSFFAAGLPVISIDTKKKELIGDFRNSGWV